MVRLARAGDAFPEKARGACGPAVFDSAEPWVSYRVLSVTSEP